MMELIVSIFILSIIPTVILVKEGFITIWQALLLPYGITFIGTLTAGFLASIFDEAIEFIGSYTLLTIPLFILYLFDILKSWHIFVGPFIIYIVAAVVYALYKSIQFLIELIKIKRKAKNSTA